MKAQNSPAISLRESSHLFVDWLREHHDLDLYRFRNVWKDSKRWRTQFLDELKARAEIDDQMTWPQYRKEYGEETFVAWVKQRHQIDILELRQREKVMIDRVQTLRQDFLNELKHLGVWEEESSLGRDPDPKRRWRQYRRSTDQWSSSRLFEIREQLGLKKWIPLGQFVAFLATVKSSQNQRVKDQYEQVCRYLGVNDDMRRIMHRQYQVSPYPLQDEIERQSREVNRSIVENVSNALDAMEGYEGGVDVSITDKGYRVTDAGVGMTPEVILERLLISRLSGKSGNETVGRFGVGFYTTLSHLKTAQDFVRITTSNGSAGYQITFRVHEESGDVMVNIEANEQLPQGTSVEIQSQDFDANNAEQVCRQHFLYRRDRDINIDGDKINRLDHLELIRDGDVGLYYDPTPAAECTVSILVHGVTIEQQKVSGLNLPREVALDYPLSCSIPQARAELAVDAQARKSSEELMNIIFQSEHAIPLANALYPVFASMQERNTSKLSRHHLMDKFKDQAQQALADVPFEKRVPNAAAFAAMNAEGYHFVHSGLFHWNPDRVEGIDRCMAFSSQTHKLYLLDFVPGQEEIVFEHEGAFYLDRKVYEQHKDSPQLLNVYFSDLGHPFPGQQTQQSKGRFGLPQSKTSSQRSPKKTEAAESAPTADEQLEEEQGFFRASLSPGLLADLQKGCLRKILGLHGGNDAYDDDYDLFAVVFHKVVKLAEGNDEQKAYLILQTHSKGAIRLWAKLSRAYLEGQVDEVDMQAFCNDPQYRDQSEAVPEKLFPIPEGLEKKVQEKLSVDRPIILSLQTENLISIAESIASGVSFHELHDRLKEKIGKKFVVSLDYSAMLKSVVELRHVPASFGDVAHFLAMKQPERRNWVPGNRHLLDELVFQLQHDAELIRLLFDSLLFPLRDTMAPILEIYQDLTEPFRHLREVRTFLEGWEARYTPEQGAMNYEAHMIRNCRAVELARVMYPSKQEHTLDDLMEACRVDIIRQQEHIDQLKTELLEGSALKQNLDRFYRCPALRRCQELCEDKKVKATHIRSPLKTEGVQLSWIRENELPQEHLDIMLEFVERRADLFAEEAYDMQVVSISNYINACWQVIYLPPEAFRKLQPILFILNRTDSGLKGGYFEAEYLLPVMERMVDFGDEVILDCLRFLVDSDPIRGLDSIVGLTPEQKQLQGERYERLINLYAKKIAHLSSSERREIHEAFGTKTDPRSFHAESPFSQLSSFEDADYDIRDIPKKIRRYFIYLAEGGTILAQRDEAEALVEAAEIEQVFGLSYLLQAKRLKQGGTGLVYENIDELSTQVYRAGYAADMEIVHRDITHAIHNLRVSDGHLWTRELMHQHLEGDSHHQTAEAPSLCITPFMTTSRYGMDSYVVEASSSAGLNLQQLVEELITRDEFLPVFQQADEVRLKTSLGNGKCILLSARPKLNDHGKVEDVSIVLSETEEEFTGTIIQKISTVDPEGDIPEMSAADLKDSISSYGGLIDGHRLQVQFDAVTLNKPREVLAEAEHELGTVRVYDASENAITQAGIYVTGIDEDIFCGLPKSIQKMVSDAGLVIDLPPSVLLIKSGDDISNRKRTLQRLSTVLPSLILQAYMRKFAQGRVKVDNLPYDYFHLLGPGALQRHSISDDILADAEALNTNRSISAERLAVYQDPQALVRLLTHIRAIPHGDALRSLYELATDLDNEEAISHEQLPDAITSRINYSVSRPEVATRNTIDPNKLRFLPDLALDEGAANHPEMLVLRAFDYLRQRIDQLMTDEFLGREYYYSQRSSIAHASEGDNAIGWNLRYLVQDLQNLHDLLRDAGLTMNPSSLEEVLKVESHEFQHVREGSDDWTHNDSFYEGQRRILARAIRRGTLHPHELTLELREKFPVGDGLEAPSLDAILDYLGKV